jgi:hypothetical protein
MDMAEVMADSARPEFNVIIFQGKEWHWYVEKAQAVMEALKLQRWLGHDTMAYADADCYFLRPCVADLFERLSGHDAAFQDQGTGNIGTGFFVMRTTDKMIQLWQRVVDAKQFYGPGRFEAEEAAIQSMKGELDFVLLPEDYWTPCFPQHLTANAGWNLTGLPPTARMVHLSCVMDFDKRRVMSQVIASRR